MARVLWVLSIRGTSFCGRSIEKGTQKMVATKTYLIGLAKGGQLFWIFSRMINICKLYNVQTYIDVQL
jgi:hypothetical protein